MKKFLKTYLPDILVNVGVWILAYYLFLPPTVKGGLPKLTLTDYHADEKLLGLVVVTIGLNIAIRRYLEKRSPKKQVEQ